MHPQGVGEAGRAAAVVLLVWAAVLLAAGQAEAASPITWSGAVRVLPGFEPPTFGEQPANVAEFRDIACPTTTLCVAVDDQRDILKSGNPTGGAATWSRAHVPSAALSGVTCRSARLCIAWGPKVIETSINPGGGAGAWTRTSIGHGSVDAVACPTTSLCLAITGANTLLVSADPSAGKDARWKLTLSHIDASYSHAFGPSTVTGLACPSVMLCVAVDTAGRVLASTHPTRTTAWSVADVEPRAEIEPGLPASPGSPAEHGIPGLPATPAIPPTFEDASLTSISCPSMGFCTAVDIFGTIAYSSDPAAGARAWRLSNVHPEDLRRDTSTDVSCASASLCVYVGSEGLSGHSPGSVRVLAGPPNRPSSYSTRRIDSTYVEAVACAPTRFCVAVDDDASLILGTYNTTPRTASKTPTGPAQSRTPGRLRAAL